MATRVGRCKISLTSFDSPTPKTHVLRKNLRPSSYTSRVIADLFQISLPWQRGLVAVKFVWRHSIARPRKNPAIGKDLQDIFHISPVIADFVPNFVVMATVFGRSRICLVSFNSKTPKNPYYTQRSPGYVLYKSSYSRFCPKFRCHGNEGWSW